MILESSKLTRLLLFFCFLGFFALLGLYILRERQIRERDLSRKYNVRSAQSLVESYFSDNARYPDKIDYLSQDPEKLFSYKYVVSPDGLKYQILARLENRNDSDYKGILNYDCGALPCTWGVAGGIGAKVGEVY